MNENLLSEAVEHIFDLSPRGIEKSLELKVDTLGNVI